MRLPNGLLLLASAAAIFTAVPALAAVEPGVTVSGNASNLSNPPFTLGFGFSTTKNFNVMGLGVFDSGSNGLIESHAVGLWNSAGALLASTTVASGTAANLTSGFRWTAVSPFLLGPGSYRVGALFLSGNDPLFFPGSGTVTAISGLTYEGGRFAVGTTLANPSSLSGNGGAYIGGNVMLTAVPEPSTWMMMILGIGLAGFALRRRQSSTTTRVRFAF